MENIVLIIGYMEFIKQDNIEEICLIHHIEKSEKHNKSNILIIAENYINKGFDYFN